MTNRTPTPQFRYQDLTMAHPSEFNIKITLELKLYDRDEGIPIDTFRKATNHFTNLLRHLTQPKRNEDRWQIHRKPTLDLEHDDFRRNRDRWETTSERVDLLLSGKYGWEAEIEDELLKPLLILHNPEFSEESDSKGHSLYHILRPKVCEPLRVLANIRDGYVTLWLYGKPFLLTGKSHLFVKPCNPPPPPPPPPVEGPVFGTLVAMSSKNSNHQIVIYNPNYKHDIIGRIDRSSNLIDKVASLFRKPVRACGLVTYDGGNPKLIEVNEIAEISHEELRQSHTAGLHL